MKYMRKLSSKLLLALGVMILGVIVWQVIVSKRVIGDIEKIGKVQSIEQMQELLKNEELKTYHAVSCRPFSKIKLRGVYAYILKGDEYAVYVSDYCKKNIETGINGNELFLNSLKWEAYNRDAPVLIFMPEDPPLVYCTPLQNYQRSQYEIYGFSGENTLLLCEGGNTDIATDMSFIHLNLKDNDLLLSSAGLNCTSRVRNVQMNVDMENSMFYLNKLFADHVNMDMQLQESVFWDMLINSETQIGTLSLKGTLNNQYKGVVGHDFRTMKINYPGQCDSLLIQLAGNPGTASELVLSNGLSGRFEEIDCSENVVVIRE